jgi:hypothetical protein
MLHQYCRWWAALAVLVCLIIGWYRINFYSAVVVPAQQRQSVSTLEQENLFPKLVHQTWKTNDISSLPSNLKSWRRGCASINSELTFILYNDSKLVQFVEDNYPEYLTLYLSLNGVYMADMARIILLYHYGGIYMDFDFYCAKPFSCIINKVLSRLRVSVDNAALNDVLIVSREPVAHALLFRNKSRVVIQDFFVATKRHPFLLWLLEDRNAKFKKGSKMKGPFSYSVEKDIDMYLKSLSGTNFFYDAPGQRIEPMGNGVANAMGPFIVELSEDVLHSLLDSTNSRLWTLIPSSPCNMAHTLDREHFMDSADAELTEDWESTCSRLQNLRYFSPTMETIAVHMWSHVYLNAPRIRSTVMLPLYEYISGRLRPSAQC